MRERKPVRKTFTKPSLTKQAFRDESNVNNIMAKYLQTGLLDHVNQHQGSYADFINAPDYHTAMNRITAADQAFQSMPSDIRKKFSNSPSEFLEFAQNPDNVEEMRELGLLPGPENTPPAAEDAATADPPATEAQPPPMHCPQGTEAGRSM